ncbi:MAG: hypothetical protein A2Y70_00620 [Candidatus Aminicenantes bacterium RBG_13_64_14]|nr:MAG: hypothetical protein A2Y70_00620 [Candidatus Aminicenantes bacterium RBG_13_64_14]
MESPNLELQTAQYLRLKARISTPVYDHVPDDAPYPFVAIGEAYSTNSSAKGESVWRTTTTIHVYSRYSGMAEAKTIVNDIFKAFTIGQGLSLGSKFRIIMDAFESVRDMREDEDTRHSVIMWWYLIEEV